MNKKILILLIVLAIAATGIALFLNKKLTPPPAGQTPEEDKKPASNLSPLNAKYLVETQLLELQNGKAESINPYGAQKQTTEVWDQPIAGDLNSDGQTDYALVLKQQTANDPAVYYYVAIALVDEPKNLIVGSNAVPLDEGIKIENISIVNQAVRVNYLTRKITGDEVEKEPTIPVSKSYILDGAMLKELTQKRANAQAEAACTDNRGEWNKNADECKGLDKNWCQSHGGNFESGVCKF